MAPTDAELIAESRENPEAFAVIFDRHFSLVFAYCARRVGRFKSEDIAGEVFCRAFASRRRYDPARSDARPWLIGIASHVVVDHLRGIGREGGAVDRGFLLETSDEFDSRVGAAIDARGELATVAGWLSSLPLDEADTLLMFVWEELSYEQVSRALAIPVGTVRSRINRARRRLRKLRADAASGASNW